MYKLIFCIVTGLCLVGGAYGASLTIVDLPSTDTDAAIGIDPDKTYTHAFDFGDNAPTIINGVAFDQGPTDHLVGADLPYVGVSSQGYGYVIDDTRATDGKKIRLNSGNDPSAVVDGDSAELLRDMIYFSGGAQANEGIIITLQDLVPGNKYSARYYYRQWDENGVERPVTVNAAEVEPITIDIDGPGAHYLDYTFIADGNDVTMTFITNITGEGPHMYGITCEEVPVALQTAGLVVENPAGLMGFEPQMLARLESLGYAVQIIAGDNVKDRVFTVADAEALNVMVVSEAISSSDMNPLVGANVPMMHGEGYGWHKLNYAEDGTQGWQDATGLADVVDDTHPIVAAAGLSAGPIDFLMHEGATTTTAEVSVLAPGAVSLVSMIVADVEYSLVFAIDTGAEMAKGAGPSPNRVVGFSLPGNQEGVLSDAGWALFDAAIDWLDQ